MDRLEKKLRKAIRAHVLRFPDLPGHRELTHGVLPHRLVRKRTVLDKRQD